MIETKQRLRIAVIAGTPENAFAHLLEKEFRHLGVETSGLPQGEIFDKRQASEADGVVFIVDKGFAATWGSLSSSEFDRFGLRKIQRRFWVTDQSHRALAEQLREKFDSDSPPALIEGSYGGKAAFSLALQIVDRLQSSFPSKERPSESVDTSQLRMGPASGSARTRTPDERERDQQFKQKLRLESGNTTLGELLSSARFGRIMTESDVNALRCGSALATTPLSPADGIIATSRLRDDWSKLTSLSVVLGYLLSASFSDDSPGSALGTMIWRLLAAPPNSKELSGYIDFWRALGLEESRAEIKQTAASDATLNCSVSSRLGKLLLGSATLIEESHPNLSFNSSYLLACIIGLPGEETDDSAIDTLESLGVNSRGLRSMFRDWLATRHPSASAILFDHVLGITAEAARGSYAPEPLPTKPENDSTDVDRDKRIQELRRDIAALEEEWAFPTDFHGKPIREDLMGPPRQALRKRITELQAQLVELEGEPQQTQKRPHMPQADEWRDGVAGIATGMVQFEDERDVEDALEIEAYATRFARVIALRDTELPLSVGLFGEWGSGKTYFMKLLRQEIRRLGEKNDASWCSRVVPIRFNAWHYLDTNLWASLVTEMFDQLFDYLAGPTKDAEKRLRAAEKVMKEIENGKGAVSEVKEEVNLLEKEKQWAEEEIQREEKVLRIAERNTNRAQKIIAARMDDLKAMLPGILDNPEWKAALKVLGLDKAVASWKHLEERLKELRSFDGRIRALVSAMGQGWWGLVSLLVLLGILALVPIALGKLSVALAAHGHLESITMAIGSASGLAVSIAGWLAAQATRARKLLDQAEKLEKAAKTARAAEEKSPQLQRLRETALRLAKQKEIASEKLNQARAKVRQLEEELREMRPERRLLRFIEERAGAKDYRQHLGLVSLVRRDFRELSRLFTEKKDGATKWEKLLGGSEKSIDRIVLYVDDLDRCQPQRVVEVLEAVHLLLDFPLFVAVVAVDPRWVKQSLRAHYSKLLSGPLETNSGANIPLNQAQLSHNDEDQATPLDYLEKIFHIPFHLPGMTKDGFSKLIGKLARRTVDGISESHTRDSDGSAKTPKESGIRQETNVQGQTMKPTSQPTIPLSNVGSEEKGAASGSQTPRLGGKALGVVHLEDWEVLHLNEYATLVRTPRAAKRFLNTYRLIRAGLAAQDWGRFRGDTKVSGQSRVAMLLLAAAAGSPALARDWFAIFRDANPTAVFFSDEDRRSSQPEWQEFKRIYDATFTETTFNITPGLFAEWLERVERFAF